MKVPVKIKNHSATIAGKVEVNFSGEPSLFQADKAIGTTNYGLKLDQGIEMLTILDTNVQPVASDDQYWRLEHVREGFERNTKLIPATIQRRFIEQMPALEATYSIKDSNNEPVPLHCLWFQVGKWLVHLELACPSQEYVGYKDFLEGIRTIG